jgi:PAS domain S-box-containing protein
MQDPADSNIQKRGLRFWLRARPLQPAVDDPRLRVVLQIEWALLALRYFALFIVLGFYAVGTVTRYSPDLGMLTVMAILHNTFTHWILYTQRYQVFLKPQNYLMHLLTVSMAVGLTGAEESPVALLYVVFIVGYYTYVPNQSRTFTVTLTCCAAYCFTVLVKWLFLGVNFLYPPIGLHLSVILLCGWLVGTLGQSLRRIQVEYQEKAQALTSSQSTLRTILDSVGRPIMVHDEDELIRDVNDRACEYLGMPREQLIGQRFRTFLFDDGALPNKLASLRKRGMFQGEMLVITADTEERTVDLLVRSFIRDGRRFFVTMMNDITEQKNLQETSRLANLRLEEVNRELCRVNELRTAFFKTISQRLRSPVSAILGFVELLLDEELGSTTAEQRNALQSCRRSVLRVFSLLDEHREMESGPGPAAAPVKGADETSAAPELNRQAPA